MKDQFLAYKTALECAHKVAPNAWNIYATYTGFGSGPNEGKHFSGNVGRVPYYSKRMPESAIAQWTLTGMLSPEPVPLREWLKDPRPKVVYTNPRWPKGLTPPTPRSTGYIHQTSQFYVPIRSSKVEWCFPIPRGGLALSTFAEACLRAAEAGLEGICFHGEVTSRTLAAKLNYLVMRHWTYHPVSTLEEFALSELAPRLAGKKEARDFVRVLCLLEENL